MRRPTRLIAAAIFVSAALGVAVPSASAQGTVLVANCGTPGYSSFRPSYWSAGCTSGSPTIEPIEWLRYDGHKAIGVGEAVVQDCGCFDPTYTARYPARVVLSKPRRCPNNRLRYYSKARITITYPAGNPFGEPPGDNSGTFHVPRESCSIDPSA